MGIILPSKLHALADMAFFACTSLIDVSFPAGLAMIGADAFGECPLTDLALPVALTTIGHRAFDGCTCIVELNLPATITFVGHGAFRGCTALAKVFLPANLTTEFIIVGEGAFTGCSALSPEAYEVIRALRTPALRSPRPLMRYGAMD